MPKHEEAPIAPEWKLGDRVKIKYYAGNPGKIVELRGPLGPNGMQVYRVIVGKEPSASYIELLGNQLEALPRASERRKILVKPKLRPGRRPLKGRKIGKGV